MANAFTADEIRTLEQQYRRIGVIPHADGEYEIAIKPAERLQWRDFRGAVNDESRRADAQEQIVRQCIVGIKYAGKSVVALSPGDVAQAREVLDELLKDWTSATDGQEISRLVFKVNGQAGTRAK